MNKSVFQQVSALFIVVLLSQVIAYNNVMSMSKESGSGNFMLVEIEHRNSEGKLLETRCIEDDLILRNMAYWFLIAGSGYDYPEWANFKPKAYDGSLISYSVTQYGLDFVETQGAVYIGEGTTAPTVLDYILESKVMGESIVDRLYWNSGTQFNVTVDGLFLIDGTYAITEIGLVTYFENKVMLLVRDTFPAINVNAGDTLTTRYYLLANWDG